MSPDYPLKEYRYRFLSTMACHIICFVSFRFVSFRFVSICFVSFRSVSFRFVSFRSVPFLFCFALYRDPNIEHCYAQHMFFCKECVITKLRHSKVLPYYFFIRFIRNLQLRRNGNTPIILVQRISCLREAKKLNFNFYLS